VYETSEHYTLLSIPFFVLAGALDEHRRRGQAHGGLCHRGGGPPARRPGHCRCLACTLFAAVSGSSPATVVAVGSIVIAGMVKNGYPMPFAAGVICNAGTLGILIPPSIVMVVYAAVTEVSVGRMFMAGVVPGLLLASCWRWPCGGAPAS
jgi:C4-dicarboxylate transporter DctM subunit